MFQLNKLFVVIMVLSIHFTKSVYSLPPPRIVKKIVEDVPILVEQSNKTLHFKSGETANLHCIFTANSKLNPIGKKHALKNMTSSL